MIAILPRQKIEMPNVLVYLVSLFGSGSDDDHLGMVSWMDVDVGKFYDGDDDDNGGNDDDDPGLIS